MLSDIFMVLALLNFSSHLINFLSDLLLPCARTCFKPIFVVLLLVAYYFEWLFLELINLDNIQYPFLSFSASFCLIKDFVIKRILQYEVQILWERKQEYHPIVITDGGDFTQYNNWWRHPWDITERRVVYRIKLVLEILPGKIKG